MFNHLDRNDDIFTRNEANTRQEVTKAADKSRRE